MLNADGSFYGGEVVALADEEDFDTMYHPTEPGKSRTLGEFRKKPLLEKVVDQGKRTTEPKKLSEIADFNRKQMDRLPEEYKRFKYPHIYKIRLSKSLKELRDRLVEEHKYISI